MSMASKLKCLVVVVLLLFLLVADALVVDGAAVASFVARHQQGGGGPRRSHGRLLPTTSTTAAGGLTTAIFGASSHSSTTRGRRRSTTTSLALAPPHHSSHAFDQSSSHMLLSSLGFNGMYENNHAIGGALIEIIKNVGIGVCVLLLVINIITFITTQVLLPEAAKQLEDNCRKDFPDLWDEYSKKLENDETLAMRPDIIQELGNKYQQRVMDEFDTKQNQKQDESLAESSTSSDVTTTATTSNRDDGVVIDAEFQKQKHQEDAKNDL